MPFQLTWLPVVLRNAGLKVAEVDGWPNRGRSDMGWVTTYRHPTVGRIDVMGLLFDLSETPGKIWGPPFVPGQHTAPILRELGHDDASIAAHADAKVVLDRSGVLPSA